MFVCSPPHCPIIGVLWSVTLSARKQKIFLQQSPRVSVEEYNWPENLKWWILKSIPPKCANNCQSNGVQLELFQIFWISAYFDPHFNAVFFPIIVSRYLDILECQSLWKLQQKIIVFTWLTYQHTSSHWIFPIQSMLLLTIREDRRQRWWCWLFVVFRNVGRETEPQPHRQQDQQDCLQCKSWSITSCCAIMNVTRI